VLTWNNLFHEGAFPEAIPSNGQKAPIPGQTDACSIGGGCGAGVRPAAGRG
jgi:hypothetical protein